MNNSSSPLKKLFPGVDDDDTHLSTDELKRYVVGALDDEERACIEVHLSACPLCQCDVSDLAKQHALHLQEQATEPLETVTNKPKWRFMQFLVPALCGAAAVAIGGVIFLGLPGKGGGELARLTMRNSALVAENEKLRGLSRSGNDASLLRSFALEIAPIVAEAGKEESSVQITSSHVDTPPVKIIFRSSFMLEWQYEPSESWDCTVNLVDTADVRNPIVSNRRVRERSTTIELPEDRTRPYRKYRWDIKFASGRRKTGYVFQFVNDPSKKQD